jgi:two-component sensor histidine kinase
MTASPSKSKLTEFEREVVGRFGVLPYFFSSAPDAPEIVEKLWDFAKAAYLDNPIPALFKERLFVYLSRFCQVRYCIVRHCAFLIGYGHSSGDPSAPPQTVEQAIRLLRSPPPWQRNIEALLGALEARPDVADWPAPETELEDQVFSAATLVFVEPGRGQRLEHLLGLLAFVRTAHYWTVLHPDIQNEDDVLDLLKLNEDLARFLLEDPEAARCDLGSRLFSELEELRGLRERDELKKAKRALEAQVEQKELLMREVNHRVKNSLQIVSSILHLQVSQDQGGEATDAMRSAAARVMAIAAVHERLYTGPDVRVVSLDAFLGNLCQEIGRALGCSEGIEVDLGPIQVPTDMAVPLALIVNELVTNAIKYASPPWRIVMMPSPPGHVTLSVSDSGQGPSGDKPQAGMGSRIVQGLVQQLGARVETSRHPDGYTVEVAIPLPAKP